MAGVESKKVLRLCFFMLRLLRMVLIINLVAAMKAFLLVGQGASSRQLLVRLDLSRSIPGSYLECFCIPGHSR